MDSTIVVRGPRALVAVLPHLIGFHPCSSVVVVVLGVDNRVAAVARADWPPGSQQVAELLHTITGNMREPAAGCVVALYPPVAHLSPPAGAPVQSAVAAAGLRLLDLLIIEGDPHSTIRWRSALCDDPRCCPPEGRPIDTVTEPAEAALVARGSAVAATRDLIVAGFRSRADSVAVDLRRRLVADIRIGAVGDPTSTVDTVAVVHPKIAADAQPAVDARADIDPEASAEDIAARIAADVRGPAGAVVPVDLLPDWAPHLMRALRTIPTRDPLIAALVTLVEELDDERCRGLIERLRVLSQVAPATHLAPVLTVCGILAWLHGDGVRANVAVARALEVEPGYTLARLLARGLEQGLPPWLVREAVAGARQAA
ncbi:MAG: DUF4192 family protein [Actinomycetales bacterium]|nr:DUF4192 family protein [Actinomycetales bacterium]